MSNEQINMILRIIDEHMPTEAVAQPALSVEDDRSPSRAADLLQQHYDLVSVSEQLPDPERKVLAHYQDDLGKGRTVCAIWVPKNTKIIDVDYDDICCDYDEYTDTYYWAQGWYETIENWDDMGYVTIDHPVLYWARLPQWPDLMPTNEEAK
ncbi:MAG: hypothetical protein FJ083_14185 [Cyanobacteria bacterium K_Offshore_surface_m2_239]|nr:hypothetical protein [Cyanobacteria bacterium K_Offshore_surface_m2_239]